MACGTRQRRLRSGSTRSWCHGSASTRPRQGPKESSPGKTTGSLREQETAVDLSGDERVSPRKNNGGSPPGKKVVPRKARHTDRQRNSIDFCRFLRHRGL